METKNNTIIIVLLALIIGLLIGYFGSSRMPFMSGNRSEGLSGTRSGGMHGAMDGMMMGLQGKTGDELDEAFLTEMIVHHEGAVSMARTLVAGTKRPELLKLGNDIITAQTNEIQMMTQWRKSWFGR
jgi:uncharacterized protein (DUF305 family)